MSKPDTENKIQTVPTLDNNLNQLFLRTGVLSEDVFSSLQERSHGSQSIFESLLINEGYLIDEQLGRLKAQTHKWSFVDLDKEALEPEVLQTLPREFAEEKKVVPFEQHGEVRVAMENPDDVRTKRLLQKKFGPATKFYYATGVDIADALTHYDTEFEARMQTVLQKHEKAKEAKNAEDSSIIELVDSLLEHATRHRASDIHIEPRKHESVVRERIDGVLHTALRFDTSIHELVAIRIKVLANLATDEHARPQDGKMQFATAGGKQVDVRVSVSPTTDGEKMVLRLLAPQDQALSTEALGLQGDDLELLENENRKSWGMVLVTGPTGSGKTTTLYAGVRRLNTEAVNIATIEDPVEYDLPGVNQIQVNEKVDVTFANGLRSIVRQDPNIILVGEIRDSETAGIAVNAAMTGHLVFSTLHTNDAATALPRLIDMGIEPFLIASTVNVIIAQRLVRNICSKCREGREVDVTEFQDSLPPEIFKKLAGAKQKIRVYQGKGCPLCDGTGYHGRTGIFELLRIEKNIEDLIMKNADADTIKQQAIQNGMHTMLDDGIEKVLQGVTTLEEVLRVIRS